MAGLEEEEERGSDQGSDLPEEFDLELSFVISGSETNLNYPVLVLQDVLEPAKHCECVAVTRVDGKILLAVPERGWHKKKAQRSIANSALTKAVRVICTGCSATARDEPEAVPTVKTWLGFLDPLLESMLTSDEVAGITFPTDAAGGPFVPYAPALVAVARDHFTFFTADEGEGPVAMEQRMDKLEDGLSQILIELGRLKQPVLAATPKPAATKQKQQLAQTPSAGLSAALVQQALHAGVSQQALAEIGALVGDGNRGRMEALAVPDKKELTSEEEDEDAGTGDASGSVDPVGKAVIQLSKIVAEMRREKAAKKDKGLESILDNAESGSAKDSSLGTSGRTHAAALRSLQKLLEKNPKLLYQEVEKLMAEDWQAGGALPGVLAMPTSARGWLEHRSKIGNYVGAIRPAWIMAGAWDDLRLGFPERARARLALGVAAYDQQAYDKGSWLLAGEMSLENPPPYASFNAHQAPEPWEAPHTRLIDSRWFDLLISKLRNLADYQEKKAKLTPSKHKSDESQPKGETPKKPQPKKAGKGSGKKGGKGEDETNPAQTTA